MSLADQVLKHYFNASGAALTRGMIVRGVAGVDQATTAQADNTGNLVGIVGLMDSLNAAVGSGFNTVMSGKARMLLEAALTPLGGQRVYVSATTAGSGTNVAPVTAVEMGVIADSTRYALDSTVEIVLYGGAPIIAGGGGPATLGSISKTFTHTDLTEAVNNTNQSIAFDDAVPAGAVVVSIQFNVSTGFSGGGATHVGVGVANSNVTITAVSTSSMPTSANNALATENDFVGAFGNILAGDIPVATFDPDGSHNLNALDAGSITITIWFLTT